MTRRLRARVSGRVQGVGFRMFTLRQGRALGLRGWVRNLPDGSVEFDSQGEEAQLLRLLEAVRRGPPAARVDSVFEEWDIESGPLPDFTVR